MKYNAMLKTERLLKKSPRRGARQPSTDPAGRKRSSLRGAPLQQQPPPLRMNAYGAMAVGRGERYLDSARPTHPPPRPQPHTGKQTRVNSALTGSQHRRRNRGDRSEQRRRRKPCPGERPERRRPKSQDTCALNRPVKASILRQRAAVAITQRSQFGCHVAVSPVQEPLQKLARCSLHLQPHEPSSSRSPVRQPGTVTVNSRFYGRNMQQPNTPYDIPKEPATHSVRGWQR